MGYAKQGQNTAGIHTRLFSRAFIVEQDDIRVAFVSADLAMMGQLVKLRVVEELEAVLPGHYSEQNLVISATHTHSGPAGFMQYVLFNVPNLGFIKQTLDAMVEGIVLSVVRAHHSIAPGRLYHSLGRVQEQVSLTPAIHTRLSLITDVALYFS